MSVAFLQLTMPYLYVCCCREDSYLADHTAAAGAVLGRAAQLELDRFWAARSLLAAAARARFGLQPTEGASAPVPDVLAADVPEYVKAKFEKKVTPDWHPQQSGSSTC